MPSPEESVLIQLARMEVMLASILEKVTGHGTRLDKVEEQAAINTLAIQRLNDSAVANKLTAVATAEALRLADEERRANDDDRRAASEQQWTPFQRTIAVTLAVVAVASFIVAVIK